MTAAAELPRFSGFAHPVFDAQASFRAVMDAMANPGRIETLSTRPDVPAALAPSLAAAALTLIDQDTPVFLDRVLAAGGGIASALAFLTGCRLVDEPSKAAFALIGEAEAMPDLADFAQGSLEYPDRSTTLLVQVERLESQGPFRLSGPGILGARSFGAEKLPADFAERARANRQRFPQGVDLLICCGDRLAGLPRSTVIAR